MVTLYRPWLLDPDCHGRWSWDSSQQVAQIEGGMDEPLAMHRDLVHAAPWHAAELSTRLDPIYVSFDKFRVDRPDKCLLQEFRSCEASETGHGRILTPDFVGSLPAQRDSVAIVKDRTKSFVTALELSLPSAGVDCASGVSELPDARNASDRPTTSFVSNYDGLLQSYSEHGQHEDTLQLLQYMLHVGVQPSIKTFASILKVLPNTLLLEKCGLFHFWLTKSWRKMNPFIGNLLIQKYVDIGSLKDAQMVFDELLHKDVVTWNLMIGGYNQHDGDQQALELFYQMVDFGTQPNVITFLCVLKSCSGMGALDYGKHIHLYIVASGLDSVMSVGATLIDMYSKCGDLEVARAIFNRSPARDLVTWSVLISGYTNNGNSKEAILLYDCLMGEGLKPDRVICVSLLRAYSDVAALDLGRILHAHVIELGLELDIAVSSALLEMYTRCGDLNDLRVTFSRLERQDVVVWSVCMARFVEAGCSLEVLELFKKMQQACMSPDEVTFISVLNACASLVALDTGKHIHSYVIGHGFELDLSIGSALIDMYMKSGSFLDAGIVFHKLHEQDIVTWSSLTAGYVQHGRFKEALELYQLMQQQGMKPNQVTFICSIKACTSLLSLNEGKVIHIQIVQSGLEEDLLVANGLIDMYGKCGSIQEAQSIFDGMPVRDAITWNVMIAAYTKNECASEAIQCFKRMSQFGIKPDKVSYVGTLKACSSISALQQGMHIHSSIVGDGMESDNFVGTALIDMYSKCGSLHDACSVFERWLTWDVVAWSAMITAYVHHGLCRHAYDCFLEMQRVGVKPNDVTFLCLLSACCHLGLIVEGCKLFKMMEVAYGIEPDLEHLNTLVDLFVHSGKWDAAEDLLETLSVSLNTEGWTTLLSACKKRANVALGRRVFHHILQMDPGHGMAHAIMKNVYVSAGMLEEAKQVDSLRLYTNMWKKPAKAYIEIDKKIHSFTVGDTSHPESCQIYQKVRSLSTQIQNLDLGFQGGYPAVDKAESNCGHCEKLAVAFGLLCTPSGVTIRVSKNLKMCSDCHHVTKMTAKIERREIIITDLYCVHHFQDGVCSCENEANLSE